MINRIFHSCSRFIEFITQVGERDNMFRKTRILSFSPACLKLINSEHSCNIFYIHIRWVKTKEINDEKPKM